MRVLFFFCAHLSLETYQYDCWQVGLAGSVGRSTCLAWFPAIYPFQMLGKLPVGKWKYEENVQGHGKMMGITGYRCVGYSLANHMMCHCLKKLQRIFMCGQYWTFSTKACNFSDIFLVKHKSHDQKFVIQTSSRITCECIGLTLKHLTPVIPLISFCYEGRGAGRNGIHEALLEPRWQLVLAIAKRIWKMGEAERDTDRYIRPCSMMFLVNMTKQFWNLDTNDTRIITIQTIQGNSNSWLHTGTSPWLGLDSPGILCYKLIHPGRISRTLDVGCVYFLALWF